MWNALDSLRGALAVVLGNVDWMLWNGGLAAIPLLLASRLFRHRDPVLRLGPLWWVGLLAFLAFLPNAPYVLTDLVHLNEDVPDTPGRWGVAFLLVPSYLIFCALGFGCYVVSLLWLGRFLARRGWSGTRVATAEVGIHALTAVGVYVGRFVRFNSWDLVSRPHEVALTTARLYDELGPTGFTTVFFVATCLLYWPAKHVVIAVVSYVRGGGIRESRSLVDRWL